MFDEFFTLLKNSRRQVVLTGAGVSTLSGIPDFRSSDGLYSKEFGHMRVEEILDIDFFINRHTAHCHDSVDMRINGRDIILVKDVLNQKLLSEFFCVHSAERFLSS